MQGILGSQGGGYEEIRVHRPYVVLNFLNYKTDFLFILGRRNKIFDSNQRLCLSIKKSSGNVNIK